MQKTVIIVAFVVVLATVTLLSNDMSIKDDPLPMSQSIKGRYVSSTPSDDDESEELVDVRDFGVNGNDLEEDTLALADAINSGEDLYFPEGTYIVSNAVFRLSENQKLYGENATITGTIRHLNNYWDTLFFLPGGNVLSGLRFEFDMSLESVVYSTNILWLQKDASNITIDNCEFVCTEIGKHALFAIKMYERGVHNIEVINNYGEKVNFLSNNISGVDSSWDITCKNNTLWQCLNGFGFNNPMPGNERRNSGRGIVIEDNVIDIIDDPTVTCFALDFAGTSDVRIAGNRLSPGNYHYSQAIHLEDDCADFLITDNELFLQEGHLKHNSWLLLIGNAENVIVENNTFYNEEPGNTAIRGIMIGDYLDQTVLSRGVVIRNNNFDGLIGAIEVGKGVRNCTIQSNHVVNHEYFVRSLYKSVINIEENNIIIQ